MKKRKIQKRKKVGLDWTRTWVYIGHRKELTQAQPTPLDLYCFLSLSVAPRNSKTHKTMTLGLCWLIEPGSHIPPKPFSQHFALFPRGLPLPVFWLKQAGKPV